MLLNVEAECTLIENIGPLTDKHSGALNENIGPLTKTKIVIH